jgi:hypothetical protein
MSNITLITPTDKLYTSELSLLLVYPSSKIKEQLQVILSEIDCSIHIYLYELEDMHEVEWLFDVQGLCDFTVIDIDNCEPSIRDLVSFMISKDSTYWLTNGTGTYYNVISKNRIFDLDFLKSKIGGTLVEKQ